MYADLNVQWPLGVPPGLAEQRVDKILDFHERLGYDLVALNVIAPTPKEAKQVLASSLAPALLRLRQAHTQLRILTRATIVLGDGTPNLSLLASEPQAFDIIAAQPQTEKQLQSCATALDIDLICIETGSRLPFPLRHKLCGAATARGVCFEVCYATTSPPRHLIANAAILFRAARNRGIVVSSGAQSAADVRAPLDIANLVKLWGLNASTAKESVSTQPIEQATQGVLRGRSAKQGVITETIKVRKVE